MEQDKFHIQWMIKERKALPVYILSAYFTFLLIIYLRQEKITQSRIDSFAGFLLLWLCISLVLLVEIKGIRELFRKYSGWLKGLSLVLSPLASFLMVEIMVNNFNLKMFEVYTLYNVIWYIIIYYLIYAVLHNARSTVVTGNFLIYLAAVVNYLVYLFRGNPILPSDLLAWQTGMSVASNYQLYFSKEFMLATLLMYFIYMVGYKLEKRKRQPSVLNRIMVLGTFILFTTVVFHEFFETDLIKSKIRVIDFFAPKYTYITYGTAFGFVANVHAMETDAPEGYSVDQVKQILAKTSKNTQEAVTGDKPNIIVIMSEAFSDLSMLGDYPTNQDYLPFLRSLDKHTTKGTLYVSVFGGATSDTEYEFLTGNSMAVMPQNCVPYQQFVTEPTDSLAATLKVQGYYNIAIHPYKPSGYKRDLVYPLLGFDEFLSMEDFTSPHLIRSFISDRDSFQKIIEEYETKGKNKPLFIFNVTMQNHGGYSSDQIFFDEDSVTLTKDSGHKTVEQYLSLVRKSDQAFQYLFEYFEKQKEPTIILIYGDHQPVVYSDFYKEMEDQAEVNRLKYQVPFILWANYDIPEDDVQQMSANYLSSYLLQTADLKGTAYNHYLMKLYQEIPVLNAFFYIDKNNMLHGFSDTNKYEEMIKQYKYIGYNNALDRKNRCEEYYYIK